MRARPVAAAIAGWIAGAAASVTVGLLALSSVEVDLTGNGSQPSVVENLNDPGTEVPATSGPTRPSQPGQSATGTPRAATSPAPVTNQRRLGSAGGYVVARCRSTEAYLVYWSPASGFRADDVERGPALRVRLAFKGEGREIKMRIDCVNGEPRADVEDETEDEDDT